MGHIVSVARCLRMVQATHQSAAVMGIALVAMGEELGKDMSQRAMEHLLQYGDPFVRCGPQSSMLQCSLHAAAARQTLLQGMAVCRFA
jgi:hypothetical protein